MVAPGIIKFISVCVSGGKAFTKNNLMAMSCTTDSVTGGFIFRPRDMGLQVSDRQNVFGVYQRCQTSHLVVQEELTSNAGF